MPHEFKKCHLDFIYVLHKDIMHMCVCVYIYVTHSHKTQDKSFIKKNEIYMCCCGPISSVNFDEKINTLRLIQKKILQF